MAGLLRFANDADCHDLVVEVWWDDDELGWPPPEVMYLVSGPITGRIVVAQEAAVIQTREEIGFEAYNEAAITQRCIRVRASTLTDGDLENSKPGTIRGAVYVPEPKDRDESAPV